jgi:predicted P-loop ATPase/GTPase
LTKKGKLTEILDLYPELENVEEFEETIQENRKIIDERLQ